MIRDIEDAAQRAAIARSVLEALPDWFGNVAARERYIESSREWTFFAAYADARPVGFLCLKPTGRDTVELAVMGVLPEYHRGGHGRALVEAAVARARELGSDFIVVSRPITAAPDPVAAYRRCVADFVG